MTTEKPASKLLPRPWQVAGLAGHAFGIFLLVLAFSGRSPTIDALHYLCYAVALLCAQRLALYVFRYVTRPWQGAFECFACLGVMVWVVFEGLTMIIQ